MRPLRRPATETFGTVVTWPSSTTEERLYGPGYLDDHAATRAFRDARPVMFSAVRKFLDHGDPDVRHTALVAAIPLVEHPALVPHRTALADHARSLLVTSTDRHHRDRALSALKGWGHDVGGLETTSDVAARERCARLAAAHAALQGGFSQDPPF